MMYHKTIGGREVFSQCKSIQMEDGSWISNPTPEQIAEAGWTEYIPPVIPEQPQTEPGTEELMAAVKRMLDSETEQLSDEEALEVAALFPTWASKIGMEVHTGERYWYNSKLYKVIQQHTVQEDWTPDTASSLYTEISIEEFPEWHQPQGSHDAYMSGDKVSHNGQHWINTIDYNTYEPGVYGWNTMD